MAGGSLAYVSAFVMKMQLVSDGRHGTVPRSRTTTANGRLSLIPLCYSLKRANPEPIACSSSAVGASVSLTMGSRRSSPGMAGSVAWLRAGDEEAGTLPGSVGLGVARPSAGEPQARSAEHSLPLVERVDVVAERP